MTVIHTKHWTCSWSNKTQTLVVLFHHLSIRPCSCEKRYQALPASDERLGGGLGTRLTSTVIRDHMQFLILWVKLCAYICPACSGPAHSEFHSCISLVLASINRVLVPKTTPPLPSVYLRQTLMSPSWVPLFQHTYHLTTWLIQVFPHHRVHIKHPLGPTPVSADVLSQSWKGKQLFLLTNIWLHSGFHV